MGINRKIIKQQNIAAKSGKYINKDEALIRLRKAEEEAKEKALKGKK